MVRRHDRSLTVLRATLLFLAPGCSRKLPTSADGSAVHVSSGRHAIATTYQLVTPAHGVTFIVPKASGTIRRQQRFFPPGSYIDRAPVGSDIQSTTWQTYGYAEIRRGLAEFVVPRFSDVFSARLFLRENRGWSASPAPPAHHQLSWYADVDLAVDTTDYERPASLIGVFDTD